MSLTWESNNGTTWALDGSSGVTTVDEDEGIFTIPTDLVIDQVIGDGGVLVQQRRSPRRVVLSFMLDETGGSVLSLWRSFFVDLAAGGSLVYSGDVDCRLTNVVLEGPDRSMTGKDLRFHETDRFTCSLIALDPWWYGPVESASGTFGDPVPWDAPIPWDGSIPWNGGASASVVNRGDVAAPCVAVVTGAVSSASMSIGGVGGWELIRSVGSGEFVSVSSVPGRKGPHRGPHGFYAGADGPVDWGLLSESSQLFELPAGESSLVFGAVGTDGSSAWSVRWAPRYLTPA